MKLAMVINRDYNRMKNICGLNLIHMSNLVRKLNRSQGPVKYYVIKLDGRGGYPKDTKRVQDWIQEIASYI